MYVGVLGPGTGYLRGCGYRGHNDVCGDGEGLCSERKGLRVVSCS